MRSARRTSPASTPTAAPGQRDLLNGRKQRTVAVPVAPLPQQMPTPASASEVAPAAALTSTRSRRPRRLTAAELEREIARLPECSRAVLLDHWERLYGLKPPAKISRNLLIRSIAYRMQEEVHGGLSAATKKRLLRLADEVRVRGNAEITLMPRIKPGTRFVREWKGALHQVTVTVTVTVAGFEWQGSTYRSLSEIARLITGTRWNGWTFFGARKRGGKGSHAKADGDRSARSIVDFINDSRDGLPLETFYDATELMPGEDYRERFRNEIGRGTLLAIVSDVYDSRLWCVFELTEAKRRRRPIVLVDIGGRRISRTFPYGANVPRVRVSPDPSGSAWIEPLLVEAMSEGLRCDLFEKQAGEASPHDSLVLPRPPELFDVIHRDDLPSRIVYPDPPLGDTEADLLRRALAATSPATRMFTLGEIT